jgi:hypothetical protein
MVKNAGYGVNVLAGALEVGPDRMAQIIEAKANNTCQLEGLVPYVAGISNSSRKFRV